jgi:serine/threonine protein kinase/tetratricopeptide (TPR) repeat protein
MASQRDSSGRAKDPFSTVGSFVAEERPALRHAGQFQPGDLVAGRFEVVRYIAHGGMGEVYEVADRHLHGVRLALKTILPQAAQSEGAQERFEREVLLARRVVHRNLCPIYDIFHAQQQGAPLLFLTMKLVHGETVEERIERLGKIPADEVAAIVEQVASALEAAHQAGILHRDVKTSNIMLEQGSDGLVAYVMDFGLARSYQGESTVLTVEGVAGTLGYLAPELLRGAAPSVASDVYAFGVAIFRMLTGQMPGAALEGEASRREAMKALVPGRWRPLVEGCLEPTVEKRFQSIAEAMGALGGSGSRRSHSGALVRVPPAISRRSLLAGAGAIVAGAAGLGAWVERERIAFWLEPLPEKKFVALMVWPSADLPGVLTSVLDLIGSRLARAERSVENLLILTAGDRPDPGTELTSPSDAVSVLGANLVLAASLTATSEVLLLRLEVLEAATKRVLRQKQLSRRPGEYSSLADAACVAAAHLLGLPEQDASLKDTDELQRVSPEVYQMFGEAERLMEKPNDAGLEDAIQTYQKALETDPKFALGYARLAMAYTEQFLLREDASALNLAQANAERALSLNARSAKGLLARGMVELLSAKPDAALNSFAESLKVDPTNPETRIDQATVYRSVGRMEDAERIYRAVLVDRPNYWLAHNELGFVLSKQARYKEAAEQFGMASAAAPQVALPVANLALTYLTMGKQDEALEACNRSLKLGPTQAAYMMLGDFDFGKGKYQAALDDYLKGEALNEGSNAIWRDIGDCYAMLGQPEKVKKSYAKAAALLATDLERTPKSGLMWATLAFYQAKAGDAEAAKVDMRNAEANHGNDVQSEFLMVQALAVLGQKEEAMQRLLKCLDRGLSPVEVDYAVDLANLEKDPRYIARVALLHSRGQG